MFKRGSEFREEAASPLSINLPSPARQNEVLQGAIGWRGVKG